MHRFALVFAIFAITSLTSSLIAQTSVSTASFPLISLDLVHLDNSENWSFFTDDENKLYYIDFEKISFNVSKVIVKNDSGVILLEDDVFDLPVNTIYELDFSDYAPGSYEVELQSFKGKIQKTVQLN